MASAPDDIPTQTDHRIKHRTSSTRTYSDDQRLQALAVYADTGSTTTAAEATGIPLSTVHGWVTRDPEIDATLEALRRVAREKLAHRYAAIAEKALIQLEDRIENGDEVVDKSGTKHRRKVTAQVLTFAASVSTDKHTLLTGALAKQTKEEQAITELFRRLHEHGQKLRGQVIDAVPQEGADLGSIANSQPQDVVLEPLEGDP